MAVRSARPPFTAAPLNAPSGHVSGDLSPYVCVYADCDKPDDMYITTDEWKKHLKDCHRVSRWICDTCWLESDNPTESEFDLEEEWLDHMVAAHNGEYDESDIPDLAEASRRTVIPPVSCPLCYGNTPLLHPETDKHIAEHLHSFALQALPWETIGPDDDTRASVGSNVGKTTPLDDSDELDKEGNWDEICHLPDLIGAILTCCTNLAIRKEMVGLPTLILKLADLSRALQGLSQRFIFYSSDVSSETAVCLIHLELIFQRLNDSDNDLIDLRALESLEADIAAELTSLNTLVELGEKNLVKPSTFRVSGVPVNWDRERLRSFLSSQTNIADVAIKSLAHEANVESQTATIMFGNVPPQLQNVHNWQIPLPEESDTEFAAEQFLAVEKDFLGITTLYAPSERDHKIE